MKDCLSSFWGTCHNLIYFYWLEAKKDAEISVEGLEKFLIRIAEFAHQYPQLAPMLLWFITFINNIYRSDNTEKSKYVNLSGKDVEGLRDDFRTLAEIYPDLLWRFISMTVKDAPEQVAAYAGNLPKVKFQPVSSKQKQAELKAT